MSGKCSGNALNYDLFPILRVRNLKLDMGNTFKR